MEFKSTKTLDFYAACILLSVGYELIEIEDFLSGNFPEKVRPVMTFAPFPDSTLQVQDRKEYYKVCVRRLYNQLKGEYPLAKKFEFKDDREWYFFSTKKAIPPYQKLSLNDF